MLPYPAWRAPYDRGLAYLRAGSVDAALRAFDEVSELTKERLRPLRSRAQVLAELLAMESACVGPEAAAKLALASPEETAVRLYAFFDDLSPVYQHFVLLRGVSFEAVSAGYTPIQLVESVLNEARTKRNLIDYLPTEILTLIGRLVIDDHGSSDAAFPLCAVSRRWRAIFSDDAQTWATVDLETTTQRTAIAKVRAIPTRGDIRYLVLRSPVSAPNFGLLGALAGRVHRLESLFLDSPGIPLSVLWTILDRSSRLISLILGLPTFALVASPAGPARMFPSLRRLELSDACPFGSIRSETLSENKLILIDWLLPVLPNLEELVIGHPLVTLIEGGGLLVVHPALRHLQINRCGPMDPLHARSFTRLVLPNLEVLDLSDSPGESYESYLFPSGLQPNTKNITHLLLHNSRCHRPRLRDQLRGFPALKHLDVRHDFSPQGTPYEIVQAILVPFEEKFRDSTCCPLLEELRFSEFDDTERSSHHVLLSRSRTVSADPTESSTQTHTHTDWEVRYPPGAHVNPMIPMMVYESKAVRLG